MNAFQEFFLKHIWVYGEFLNGCNSVQSFIRNDQVPCVPPQIWVAFWMDVSTLLSFCEIKEGNLEFASEEISNNDIVLSFNVSAHFKLH